MVQNAIYTLNSTATIGQGDTNSTRDGDAIILCHLKLKGFYNSATAANGYSCRIIVGYSGEEYNLTSWNSAGLTADQIFLPSTATVVATNGQINPKAITVIHDEKLTCNSQIADIRDRVDFSIDVPLRNKRHLYQEAGSALGKTTNLYICVLSDAIGGSPGVTDTGGLSITYDLVYKNA